MKDWHQSFDMKKIREIPETVSPLLANRWSPRCYSGEKIKDHELEAIFHAAKLSPSSYNMQSWKVIYAHRDTAEWDLLFDLLIDWNKGWVKNSSVLLLFLSKTVTDQGKPNQTASFDMGAFWMSLALEAYHQNCPAHGMSGFNYEKARKTFKIPDIYKVEAMACIGKVGNIDELEKQYREKESPSSRKSLDEIFMNANRASETLARS